MQHCKVKDSYTFKMVNIIMVSLRGICLMVMDFYCMRIMIIILDNGEEIKHMVWECIIIMKE